MAIRLGLASHEDGDRLRASLLAAGDAVAPYLLVARLAQDIGRLAIEEVARRVLSPHQLAACRSSDGHLDWLLLHLVLFDFDPKALGEVWALDRWQRQSLRQFVQVGTHRPQLRLNTPRTGRQIERIIDRLPPVDGGHGLEVRALVPRPDGALLIALIADDSTAEAGVELIQLEDGGSHLRLTKDRSDYVLPLAQHLVSELTGRVCRYELDRWVTCPSTALRLVDAAVDGTVAGLRLVQVEARQLPLAGGPSLVLKANPAVPDLGRTVRHFERALGPLTRYPSILTRVRLALGEHHVTIHFPEGQRKARFKLIDAHVDAGELRAMRDYVQEYFGRGAHGAGRVAG